MLQIPFDQAGRTPVPGDNVAIASRRLEAGTRIAFPDRSFLLPHTVLEGHRFALRQIPRGQSLLSWGLPFGTALRDIAPGHYICNARILEALRQRHVSFELPETPNFADHLARYEFEEAAFRPGRPAPPHAEARYFQGYARGGNRGVGTRNFILVLGTSSRTGSYARMLAERFKEVPQCYGNIDGVVPIAHTEGGGSSKPNNLELLLRTLAGFLVNPNVSAVLAVDYGTEPVTNAMLQQYMGEHNYPLDAVTHRFLSLRGNYQSALAQGEAVVKSWLDKVNADRRSPQALENLRIGLQCGGSDAFSGVSGNPLVGWVSKELVRYGGSANLAETDELIGAEAYILQNVRDLATARKFLATLERFQERVAWHGHTAEGNPSGGNNFRGLYNIAIKSIGAARKKDPEVCLDYVIDYAERMSAPGFYFMDSPGNDLESIAGQVGAGCNMILFTTGNGSITNFPFVPTIKIMTNTGRYQMLTREMDVNAGRYQDGTPMDVLGAETFELMIEIASGRRSVGEHAGHSQVQLWREWRQTDGSRLDQIQKAPLPEGEPIRLRESGANIRPADGKASPPRQSDGEVQAFRLAAANLRFQMLQTRRGYVSSQVGLIVPTSLCSGQIGRLIADKLNRQSAHRGLRYVALAHTEGCGVSGGDCELLYLRTMAGYLSHPCVRRSLLLEHGCEKTHNDAMRNFLQEQRIDESRFGYASVQLDGGLESVTSKVIDWFQTALEQEPSPEAKEVGLEALQLGLTSVGPVSDPVAEACAELILVILSKGGTIVLPQNSSLWGAPAFSEKLGVSPEVRPTLAYGQTFTKAGLHMMQTPTDHYVETLTGLGATGVPILLVHTPEGLLQSHPMIPLLQISSSNMQRTTSRTLDDLDLVLNAHEAPPAGLADEMLRLIVRVAAGEYTPKLFAQGNTDFQMTRGWLGVSL